MMQRLILILHSFLHILILNTIAQTKKLSIENVSWDVDYSLSPSTYSNMQWKNDTNFTYLENNNIYIYDIISKNECIMLSLSELNEMMNKNGEGTISYLKNYSWINNNQFYFKHNNNFYIVNVLLKEIIESIHIPPSAKNIEFCKTAKAIAYTINNMLYIKTINNKVEEVCNEQNKNIICGEYVHRNEFGINNGSFWSPGGNYLAFYRKDVSKISNYPLVNINNRIASVENIKYPMAGMKSEEVTIGIYSIKNKRTVYLKTGKPNEQYLTNICWHPNEKYIYVAVLNREQNHLKFNEYETSRGTFVRTLFEEKNEKYVEPMRPAIFMEGLSEKFLWLSEKDGYNHIYLYNLQNNILEQVTSGNWEVIDIKGFFNENIIFTSTKESPIDQNIYNVNIQNKQIEKLSFENGIHEAIINNKGNYLIDKFSNIQTPNKILIINTENGKYQTVLNAPNPLKDYELANIEISTLNINDSVELYYRVIKPSNIDSSKKYPVLVTVYGGPHFQMILNNWLGGALLWDYYMAQEGFIVFSIDNRGSENRGFDFESIIYRNLGQIEILDQLKGIKFLKTLSYVDTNRIGVYGWSYGGFMAISLMVDHPDIFKTGVAGGAVTDWKYYEVMYTERYMDTPEDNPAGYEKANLNNKVENLNGNLLLIHGAKDNVVVLQHSYMFLNACISAGKQVDFFVYPNHEHSITGYDRVHLDEKISQYFIDHLKTNH